MYGYIYVYVYICIIHVYVLYIGVYVYTVYIYIHTYYVYIYIHTHYVYTLCMYNMYIYIYIIYIYIHVFVYVYMYINTYTLHIVIGYFASFDSFICSWCGLTFAAEVCRDLARNLRGFWRKDTLDLCDCQLDFLHTRVLSTGPAWDRKCALCKLNSNTNIEKRVEKTWKYNRTCPDDNFLCARPWTGLRGTRKMQVLSHPKSFKKPTY